MNSLKKQIFSKRRLYIDLRGLGITRQFGLFRTSESKFRRFLSIGRLDDFSVRYHVLFDRNGLLSDDSPITSYSGNVIVGKIGDIKNYDWGAFAIFCQVTGHVTRMNNGFSPLGALVIVNNDFIYDTNGNKALQIMGSRGFGNLTYNIPELDSDKSWSNYIIVNPENNNRVNNIGGMGVSGQSVKYFTFSLDKSSNKLASKIVTENGTYETFFIDSQADILKKRLLYTHDASTKITSTYLNKIFQDSITLSGDYDNNYTRLLGGGKNTSENTVAGTWQFQTMHDRVLTNNEMERLDDKMNDFLHN